MNLAFIVYIIGYVITIEGAAMMLPALCGLVYREQSGWAYFIVGLVIFLLGLIIIRKRPSKQSLFAREGFLVVSLSWLAMSLIGAIPLCISGDIPDYTDALFETVSGFTTTGSSILTDVESLSHAGLFWRSFTHWIGGMGVFVFLLSIMPLVGGNNIHLMRAESPGPSVGKLVPKMRDTAKILYGIYIVMTVVLIIALLIAGMPLFDTLTTSFGTAGTGGFGIKADSIAGYNDACKWIITVGMILFGINFNAYFYLLGKNKKEAFKIEEVRCYLIIILVASVIIGLNIYSLYGDIYTTARESLFHVGSIITSTGYATTDFNLWPSLSKTVLVILMLVGACAGSTGGGIKVSRVVIVFKMIRQEFEKLIHPRSVRVVKMDGKPLDKSMISGVFVFLTVYAMLFCASVLLISIEGNDIVTNFTSVLTCLSNIGPGLELVGPAGNFAFYSNFSKAVLIFDMLAGRLELFPLLILFSPGLWKKH